MKIMVTGANGQLGSLVIEELTKRISKKDIIGLVRNPEKAQYLIDRGIDVRIADYNDEERLVKAFQGIDKLLLISSSEVRPNGDKIREAHHLTVIKAAKRAGVKFIAFTSAPNAETSDFFLAPVYKVTEKAIRQSGMTFSFLRNNWYLENEIGTIIAAMTGTPWISSAGDGKVGWVLRKDLAEATANVLVEDGHENTVYELAGPMKTQQELASDVAAFTGRAIEFKSVDDETHELMLSEVGLPKDVITTLLNVQKGIRERGLEVEKSDLEQLLGRPATPIQAALESLLKKEGK